MDTHSLDLEARLRDLEQQIQFSLSLFTSAASELEHVRQEVRRATGQSSAHAVLPGQQLADPYQQLLGSFQPRFSTGKWLGVTSGRLPFGGDGRGGNATHLDRVPPQQDTAKPITDTRGPGLPDVPRYGSPSQGYNQTAPQHAVTGVQEHQVTQHTCAAEQQQGSPAPPTARSQQLIGKAAAAAATPAEVDLLSGDDPQQAASGHILPADPSQHDQGQQAQRAAQQRTYPATHLQSSPEVSVDILAADTDSRLCDSRNTADSSGISNEQPPVAPDSVRGEHPGLPALLVAGSERGTSDQDVAGPEDTHTGIFRVPLPGDNSRFRTAATYNNDPWWLAASGDQAAAYNQTVPDELESVQAFVAHREEQLAEVLALLSHGRRELGWDHTADAEDEDDHQEQQQQQEEESSIDMGIGSHEQQQLGQEQDEMAVAVHAASGVRRRKQTAPKQSPAAQRSVPLFSESDSEEVQPRHTAFTELLQSLASVHNAPAAAIAEARGAAAAGPSSAAAFAATGGFHSAEMQEAFVEMQKLVQEDVQRLAQQWEQLERPKLQRFAADIWQEVHTEVSKWEQTLADRQSKLEGGMRELAKSHTDNVTAYKADRKRLTEALREWVFLCEGARFVYGIAQLAEPPSAAEAVAVDAQAAGGASDHPSRRGREAIPAQGSSHSRNASSTSNSSNRATGNGSRNGDSFIDDSNNPVPPPEAPAVPDATQAVEQSEGAGKFSCDSSGSSAEGTGRDTEGADRQVAAWNIARVATGSTQVLLGAKQLKRLQRQAALQQQGKGSSDSEQQQSSQQQQQQQDSQEQHSQMQPGEGQTGNSSEQQQSQQLQDQEQISQQPPAVGQQAEPQLSQEADNADAAPVTAADKLPAGADDEKHVDILTAEEVQQSKTSSGDDCEVIEGPGQPVQGEADQARDLALPVSQETSDAAPAAATGAAADVEATQAAKPAVDVAEEPSASHVAVAVDQQQDEPTQDADSPLGDGAAPAATVAAGDQQSDTVQIAEGLPGDGVTSQPAAAPEGAGGDVAEQQQEGEPMQTAESELLLDDLGDDEQPFVGRRTRRRSVLDSTSSSGSSKLANGLQQQAPAEDQQQEQEAQQPQQLPAIEGPSVDDLDLPEQVSAARADEEAVPAGEYIYPGMVKRGPVEPGLLQLDQPCELLQGVTGGEHVTWMDLQLQQHRTMQPRWHCWQDAAALLEADQQTATARVHRPGLIEQVPLAIIRPVPSEQLCSLIPADVISDGQDLMDWATSSEGLLHLTRALRPGVLLEIRKRNSSDWVPAVVLHSRMTRPGLSDHAKDLLQQHSKAAADGAAGAAGSSAAAAANGRSGAGRRSAAPAAAKQDDRVTAAGLLEAGNSLRQGASAEAAEAEAAAAAGEVPEGMYEAPDDGDVVLVLLLLGSSMAGDVRHIKWSALLEQPARLRYMMHWRSTTANSEVGPSSDSESQEDNPSDSDAAEPKSADSSSSSSELPIRRSGAKRAGKDRAAAGRQNTAVTAADDSVVIQGSWQRLLRLECLPVNRWAKHQLEQEHKAWLKELGWPMRRRRKAGEQQLSDQQLQQIARKLARRPTAAAVTPALKKAAGMESSRTRQGSKRQRWHKIAPRAIVGDIGAPAAGGDASPIAEPTRKRSRGRRQQVLQDDSDLDLPAPKAKRQRTRYRLRGQQPASESDEVDPSEFDSLSPPPVIFKPARKRLSHVASAAAAAVAGGESSVSNSEEEDWQSCSSSKSGDSSSGDAGAGDRVVLSKDMCLLFDDEPSGPLNPRLPRCWFVTGTAANQQVLKAHQISGLRFMYNCLVKDHSSAAIERRQQQQKQKGKKQKQSGRKRSIREAASAADDDADSDFLSVSDDGSKRSSRAMGSTADGDSSSLEEGTASDQAEADDAGGCILAHSMGLGKSFQTIALLWVFFQRMRGRALLVVPVNVVPNWVDEFRQWLPPKTDPDSRASRLNTHKVFMAVKGGRDLARVVEKWMCQEGAVLVMSYDLFLRAVKEDAAPEDQPATEPLRNPRIAELSRQSSGLLDSPVISVDGAVAGVSGEEDGLEDDPVAQAKTPAAQRERVRRALLDGASLVVADEAHQMKNSKSQKCRMMRQVSTMRRLALTGYPLQNKLEEYYQMILWVQPEELFMGHHEFKKKFTKPITEGQQHSATTSQRRQMAAKLSVLHDLTASFIQRAGPEILVRDLPPKHEYVLALAPTPTQANLLRHFLDLIGEQRSLFRDYRIMRKILDTRDHGYEDMKKAVQAARSGRAARLEVADAAAGAAADDKENEQQLVVQAADQGASRRNVLPLEMVEALLLQYPQQQQGLDNEGLNQDQPSTGEAGLLPKEIFIKQLIKIACIEGGEKVVIFSESLIVLDALEVLLQQEYGYRLEGQYVRLEGKTGAEERRRLIRKFNRKPQINVFLISTLAGSVGINLVAAHRMVLYDMPWNPVHNKQAVSRIWRYGQTQPCFMYHLMYSGTVEQHMYEQTLAKLELFERVVERQSKRAASDYVSEQLQTKAYMLQQVIPLGDSQLVERLDAVLSKPATAAATAGGSSGGQGDKVLRQILQQPATVRALALVDLKNHEDQLKDDPTSKLDTEEKRKAALAFERERRKLAYYHSATAATQPAATQGHLGAAGISDRTKRYERRRQMRMEELYGKDFTEEAQQPEPVPTTAAAPEPAPAAAWPVPTGPWSHGGAAAGGSAAVSAGLAAVASAVAGSLGLGGLMRNKPGQRQQLQQAQYVQYQQQTPVQQQQQQHPRLAGMPGALHQPQPQPYVVMAVPAPQKQQQQFDLPVIPRLNGTMPAAAAYASPPGAAAAQAARAAVVAPNAAAQNTPTAAAAAEQMINDHGLAYVIKLVCDLALQLPRTNQRASVTQWLQSVTEGRMSGVELWCKFTALQRQVQQQMMPQQQAQSPLQQPAHPFLRQRAGLQQQQQQHPDLPSVRASQLQLFQVPWQQQQHIQASLQQQQQQQQAQKPLQQQQQQQLQQEPGPPKVVLGQPQHVQTASQQQQQLQYPGLPKFKQSQQEDWQQVRARASAQQQPLPLLGTAAQPPPPEQAMPQGTPWGKQQRHTVLPGLGTESRSAQLLSAAHILSGTAPMGRVMPLESTGQAPPPAAGPAAANDQQPTKRVKQERGSYGAAAGPVSGVPNSDVIDLTDD